MLLPKAPLNWEIQFCYLGSKAQPLVANLRKSASQNKKFQIKKIQINMVSQLI